VRSTRRESDVDGAAAVEFAVILPLLLLIVAGIIEFGFMFNAQIGVTHAAREGARVAAIGTGDPVAAATGAFTAVPQVSGFSAAVTRSCPNTAGARVDTRVSYAPLVLPISARTLRSEAVMRCNG
jgi:Flp pilus assembly protein TadG